jgi:CheY-like chemotaxis protein
MPTLDGFEVCKLIQNDPDVRDVEIIAITGHDNPENVQRILNAGATMLLRKPIRFREIKDIVLRRLAVANGNNSVEA